MGWGSKKAAAPQPARAAPTSTEPYNRFAEIQDDLVPHDELLHEEPEPPPEKPTDAAKAQLAWHKFKSGKGYTDATVAMLMYEFIASRALFADLVKFAGRKR